MGRSTPTGCLEPSSDFHPRFLCVPTVRYSGRRALGRRLELGGRRVKIQLKFLDEVVAARWTLEPAHYSRPFMYDGRGRRPDPTGSWLPWLGPVGELVGASPHVILITRVTRERLYVGRPAGSNATGVEVGEREGRGERTEGCWLVRGYRGWWA